MLARSHGYSAGSWATHNYYHADGGGNITMLIDASQVTVASYRYDCYGNIITMSGGLASANLYRFSSKEFMYNSGLYYYGYRFYDPNLQRWPNRDPINEEGGFNLYGFVGNDPCNWIDSDGRAIIPPWPWPPSRPYYPPAPPPQLPPWPHDPRGFPGNCYNYACNRPPAQGTVPRNMYPGERAGLKDPGSWNCQTIAAAVKADYPNDPNVGSPPGGSGSCPSGYHKIRPEVPKDGSPGFHFKRQNPDGLWSEKDGEAGKPTICRPKRPIDPGMKQCPDICVPN